MPRHVTDTIEIFGFIAAFWRFLLQPSYRRRAWASFLAAGTARRAGMLAEAGLAATFGLVALALVLWITFTIVIPIR